MTHVVTHPNVIRTQLYDNGLWLAQYSARVTLREHENVLENFLHISCLIEKQTTTNNPTFLDTSNMTQNK